MKKLLLLTFALGALIGCSSSPEESLISDYEQTLDGTKIDLKFEALETKLVGQVMATDSLAIYKEYLEKKSAEKIEYLEKWKARETDPEAIADREAAIQLYKTNYAGTFLEPVYKKVQEFEQMGEAKIGDIYECKYKINNPILGGVEQELTKKYLISQDKSKILARVK
jgi:hypothetical protein